MPGRGRASLVGLVVKNPPADAGVAGFDPWVGKIPWSRKWQLTPVFLPGKFHGQRNLVGYSTWARKESDMTEHTHSHKISVLLFVCTLMQMLIF